MARRHRVYKRLLFAPAMYREDGSEEDFEYLKYYRRRLMEDLEQMFDVIFIFIVEVRIFCLVKNAGLAQFFPVIIRWRIFCFCVLVR